MSWWSIGWLFVATCFTPLLWILTSFLCMDLFTGSFVLVAVLPPLMDLDCSDSIDSNQDSIPFAVISMNNNLRSFPTSQRQCESVLLPFHYPSHPIHSVIDELPSPRKCSLHSPYLSRENTKTTPTIPYTTHDHTDLQQTHQLNAFLAFNCVNVSLSSCLRLIPHNLPHVNPPRPILV